MQTVTARPWNETAAGTNSGATATHAAETNVIHFIDHVSGHGDADCTVQLKDGSTVIAEWKFDVSVEGWNFDIPNGLWQGTPGNAVSAVVSASSADCQVNITGYSIP